MKALTTFLLVNLLGAAAAAADTAVPPANAESLSLALEVRRENLLNELSRQLSEHYRLTGDLQLELLRPWNPAVDPTAVVELSILESPPVVASSLLVRVRLQSAGHALGEYTLSLRAQLLREVWVTREPVERGGAFDATSLESRRVDVLRERDALAATEGEGLTFARSVSAGRILTWRDVARRALVRKGQVIEVAATDGGSLTITMKALAMENGAAGETVKVRNLETRKEFAALVVSESHAQVRF